MKKLNSFNTQFLTLVISVVLLLSFLGGYTLFSIDKHHLGQLVEQRIHLMIKTTAKNAAYAAYTQSEFNAKVAFEHLNHFPEFISATLLDWRGQTLWQLNEPLAMNHQSHGREVSFPLHVEHLKESVGSVVIQLSTQSIATLIQQRYLVVAGVFIIQLLFAAAAIIYFVRRFITDPIEKTTTAIHQLNPQQELISCSALTTPEAASHEVRTLVNRVNGFIKALNASRKEKDHLRQLLLSSFENLQRGLLIVEPNGECRFCNKPMWHFLDEMGINLRQKEHVNTLHQQLKKLVNSTEQNDRERLTDLLEKIHTNHGVARADLSTESKKVFHIAFSAVKNSGALITLVDASESRNILKRLHETDKLHTVGQLAAGYAHDVNNFLAIIAGQLELMSLQLAKNKPVTSLIESALEVSYKAAARSRDLLTYSRPQSQAQTRVDGDEFCRSLKRSVQPLLNQDIRFSIRNRSSQLIAADNFMLQSCVLNLVLNARDAIDGKGQIQVTLSDLDSGERPQQESLSGPSSYIKITIEDNGCGISEENVGKIFQPFYTSRGETNGTGLGLSIVKSFIESNQGRITVKSTLGLGTEFTLLIPGALAESQTPSAAATQSAAASLRILLIEDESLLGQSTQTLLTEQGHRVCWVNNATKAKVLIAQCLAQFDLIITDVMLSDGNGIELCEQAAALNPALPLIVISGNIPEPLLPRLAPLTLAAVFNKPAEMSALSALLQRLANQQASSEANRAWQKKDARHGAFSQSLSARPLTS